MDTRNRTARGSVVAGSVVAGLALLATPALTDAATSTQSLVLTGGALSIGTVTPGSISGAVGATVSGGLPSAPWSDATGLGLGWNGTIASSLFHYQGSWAQTSGTTTALGTTTSGNFTAVGEGSYVVTITSVVGPLISYSYSGFSTGTGTDTQLVGNTTSAVANGATITWAPTTTTYATGMQYSIPVGNLPATAMVLNNASSGTITQTSGSSPPPVFVNQTATPAEGSGADPTTTVGAATKFVSAQLFHGAGTYTVAPSATLTSDATAWANTYVAQITYTIASTP